MPTKQELTIHGVKVLRPEPTKPDSLRCRLGFHDMVQFAIEGNFIYNQYPEYCTRCSEFTSGLKIPPRPKMPMPKIKPAKVDRDLSIEHAKELLRANGYVVMKPSVVSEGKIFTGTIQADTIRGTIQADTIRGHQPKPVGPHNVDVLNPPGDE